MPIIISGQSQCCICGGSIRDSDSIRAFSSFVPNELDPLFIFNDAVCHTHCLEAHLLGQSVIDRYAEFEERCDPMDHTCDVCGEEITDPDEFFGVGHLTDDTHSDLRRYNYVKMHKSCIARWTGRNPVLMFLQNGRSRGTCRGRAIDYIIGVLKESPRLPIEDV